jgi:hypothetical protein
VLPRIWLPRTTDWRALRGEELELFEIVKRLCRPAQWERVQPSVARSD